MLDNLTAILKPAQAAGYAVGSFNIYSYETIRGVMETAARLNRPAIVAFGENYLKNMELTAVSGIVNALLPMCAQPVALHLDHCKSFDHIIKALNAGFTSIMFDASAKAFEDNVRETAEIVKIAHASGASVEAELGSIQAGVETNEEDAKEVYTDPAQAAEFVQRTGVDALAVSIGTVHGMYKGEPCVDVDRLKLIREKVDVPLVLHGGSGTPEDVIKNCIDNGICKINVNTEISVEVVAQLAEKLKEAKRPHLSQLGLLTVAAVSQVVEKYMVFFQNNR